MVRQAGGLTCGDVFALGMMRIREGIAPGRRFGPMSEAALRLAISSVIKEEIPEAQATLTELPNFYDKLEDASVGVLLPAAGPAYSYDHYHELDFRDGPLTVGDFADEGFEARLVSCGQMTIMSEGPIGLGKPDHVLQTSQHIDGLLEFRTEAVLPATQQFNALVSSRVPDAS